MKSILFRTLDDDDTPGFKVFFFLGVSFGAASFIGGWGSFGLMTGVFIGFLVFIIGYSLGVLVNILVDMFQRARGRRL